MTLDTQINQSTNPLLVRDEWILFQVKEGPCAAACTYCYETPVLKKLLEEKRGVSQLAIPKLTQLDKLNNAQLAQFVTKNRETLGLEISLAQMESYFAILKDAGINRAGLIGSEPTSHSQFSDILDAAKSSELDLLVYSGGMRPDLLMHDAITDIVLHLDYGRLGTTQMRTLLEEGKLPPDTYMNKINNLVSSGKKLDLRVNFTNKEMDEKQLVENFYEKLTPENRQKVLLKYSMTTRVFGESQENFFTPDLLKAASPTILRFVDEFKEKFPTAPMYAERPLFPCSFDEKTWDTYAQKGGFTSTCDMEFTVYPNTGLALCPPSRALEPGLSIQTPAQLRSRISELRRKMETIYRIPSFSNCDDCEKRIDLSCQGGCLGYKVGLEHNLG